MCTNTVSFVMIMIMIMIYEQMRRGKGKSTHLVNECERGNTGAV
jgi:hypothetical protein